MKDEDKDFEQKPRAFAPLRELFSEDVLKIDSRDSRILWFNFLALLLVSASVSAFSQIQLSDLRYAQP